MMVEPGHPVQRGDLHGLARLPRATLADPLGFDEIKDQWGWGGHTTHDIERCAFGARAVTLICNWWSWCVRPAHAKTRLEAVTSRLVLLAAVGRMTQHSRTTKLVLASRMRPQSEST